jgi:hypothetical protein
MPEPAAFCYIPCEKFGLGCILATADSNVNSSEQASRGYEYRSQNIRCYWRSVEHVYRQSFGRGMRFVSKTNTQMSSGTDSTIRPSRKQSPACFLKNGNGKELKIT